MSSPWYNNVQSGLEENKEVSLIPQLESRFDKPERVRERYRDERKKGVSIE